MASSSSASNITPTSPNPFARINSNNDLNAASTLFANSNIRPQTVSV